MLAQQTALTPQQAAVMFALQRCIASLSMEADQLAKGYGDKLAAELLLQTVELLRKSSDKYLAEVKHSIIIPALSVSQ